MPSAASSRSLRLRLTILSVFPFACNAQLPCLKDAWKAFDAKQHQAAIRAADTCIGQFADQAKADELSLTGQPVQTGTQPDQAKAVIFARGVLNDTGAAYYIKGESARTLAKQNPSASRINEARHAYEKCIELKHAVTWDPQGWFWSTADTCAKMMKLLPPPAGSPKAVQKKVPANAR
jgi:hypothetical protein